MSGVPPAYYVSLASIYFTCLYLFHMLGSFEIDLVFNDTFASTRHTQPEMTLSASHRVQLRIAKHFAANPKGVA